MEALKSSPQVIVTGSAGTGKTYLAVAKAIEAMKRKIDSPLGRIIYGRRIATVEPVFGLIKHVMKFRQFLLRGLASARGEWSLVCLAWNMKRMNALGA